MQGLLYLSFLASLLSASPPSTETLLRSGLEAMGSGNLPEARADLETAGHQAPSNPQVCLALTQLYARSREEKLRSESAMRCVALAHTVPDWPAQGAIHNYLGKIYLANAEFPHAIAEYREGIRLSPYEEGFRFDLAQALLGHEEFAEAADALEAAQKVFDKSVQIELALGVAYYGQRRFPEAVNCFLRTIELAPDVVQPYVFLGKMIDQAGSRLPEVQTRFREFQKANSESYLGYLLLAKALAAGSSDQRERETLLRKSIDLKKDLSESHYELGVLLETRHEFTEAAKELERSAQLNPDAAQTHYHLARVYDRLNRPEAAAQQRALHAQLTAHEKVTAGMEASRQ